MEVTYTTTVDDYTAFGLHSLKRSPSMRRRQAFGWFLPPLGLWLIAAVIADTQMFAITMLAAGVLYFIVHPFLIRSRIESAIRDYAVELGTNGVIGRITLVLTDETLTERTSATQSVARWQDMKGFEIVGDRLYIYITGLSAAIIPKHGFERPEEFEAVRDFAIGRLTKQENSIVR